MSRPFGQKLTREAQAQLAIVMKACMHMSKKEYIHAQVFLGGYGKSQPLCRVSNYSSGLMRRMSELHLHEVTCQACRESWEYIESMIART